MCKTRERDTKQQNKTKMIKKKTEKPAQSKKSNIKEEVK